MIKIEQLVKFITDLNPQQTPARLSFYNFLRSFADPNDTLSPGLIDLFFCSCLDYNHWVSNKNQLGQEIQFLLINSSRQFQKQNNLKHIQFPQTMQVIELEHVDDGVEVLTQYIKSRVTKEGDRFRIVVDQNKRFLALILKEDRNIEIHCYDKKFTLRKGLLEPLRRDLILHYTQHLELSPSHVQKIEIAPHVIAQFTIQDNLVTGSLVRGYVYQKFMELKEVQIQDQPRLFFAVKRLEQFIVDRKTDPYYQNLVNQIERCQQLIQQGEAEALNWSLLIITESETALENIFIGDKFLQLLIRDLSHTVEQAKKSVFSTQTPTIELTDVLAPQRTNHPVEKRPVLSSSKSQSLANLEIEEECLKIEPLKELDSIN